MYVALTEHPDSNRASQPVRNLDLEWNNLALQGMYLPFVHETLRHLVDPETSQRAYTIGETISLESIASEAAELDVTYPNGESRELPAQSGVLEASNAEAVANQLMSRGVTPVDPDVKSEARAGALQHT